MEICAHTYQIILPPCAMFNFADTIILKNLPADCLRQIPVNLLFTKAKQLTYSMLIDVGKELVIIFLAMERNHLGSRIISGFSTQPVHIIPKIHFFIEFMP